MADFTLWGYAVAPAVGWTEDDFRLAYRATAKEAFEAVIENDPVATGILSLLYGPGVSLHGHHNGKEWQGSTSELWEALRDLAGEAAKAPGFPRSPEVLGWALKRVTPALAWRGVKVTKGRTSAGSALTIEASG